MVAKKVRLSAMLAIVVVLPFCAEASGTVKAALFVRDISCKVGAPLAGYGINDISVANRAGTGPGSGL